MMSRVEHTLEPVFDDHSKTLILGSMPSITSRAVSKYYGHPQNRFWKILGEIYGESTEDWRQFILTHHLALWDVISSCEINSSSDASIKDVCVNDIASLVEKSDITNIFLLGKSAYDLYNRYIKDSLGIEGIYLPSPSSANASYSLEDLIEKYSIIKNMTD